MVADGKYHIGGVSFIVNSHTSDKDRLYVSELLNKNDNDKEISNDNSTDLPKPKKTRRKPSN